MTGSLLNPTVVSFKKQVKIKGEVDQDVEEED